MKRMLFISTLSLLVAASLNAQLRVDSLGNIRVNTTANSNYKFDLISSTLGFQSTVKNSTLLSTVAVDGSAWHQVTGNAAYGVRGRVYGSWLEGPCYGIYGATNTSSNSQNYGVWGSIAPDVGGAAIYGTIYYSSYILDNHYAGYFDGPVKVQGNLNVTGTMLNSSAPILSSSLASIAGSSLASTSGYSNRLTSLTPSNNGVTIKNDFEVKKGAVFEIK